MDSQLAISRLRGHQRELQALGLRKVSLFGSTARGDGATSSDVDLAVTLDDGAALDVFGFAALAERLSTLLGARVDLVTEPARNSRMQAQINRDRISVF